LRIDRDLSTGETITQRTICDIIFFDNTVQLFDLAGQDIWRIIERSFELRSQGGAEGHGDFLQISGIRALWKDDTITTIKLTDHVTFADNLERDHTTYIVATTDYVSTISKHYKAFFAGKTARPIGPYNRMFDAAIRRLVGPWAYFPIVNDRWLPAEKDRNLLPSSKTLRGH
jgi:2',3'-cyclic-nucleotide 2'-phosphodiesterase (5'-nucleotidase family)